MFVISVLFSDSFCIWVVPVLFLKSVRGGIVDFVDDFFYESIYKKIACAKFQPLISFLIPAGIF